MAETPRPNVSYPFDGQPPDNLPVVDEPVSLISGLVTFDATAIALNQVDLSGAFDAHDEGGLWLSSGDRS